MQNLIEQKQISRPVLWMAGGTVLVVLGLIGLAALAPIHRELPTPKLILSIFFQMLFGVGWATVVISINCWLNLRSSRQHPIPLQSFAGPNNPILPWPELRTAGNGQYA